jgi:SAM-dependent methyltransferase
VRPPQPGRRTTQQPSPATSPPAGPPIPGTDGPARDAPGEAAGNHFGSAADLYDRARPGYPAEAVACALPDRVGRLLDIGAGSGKLTVAVLDRASTIIAVDPSAPMLAQLTQRLPGVDTIVGRAENTGLAQASCDAAIAGAVFHWFTRPAADAELARVLRPGAPLTLLWNPIDPADPVQRIFGQARQEAGLTPEEFDPTITLDQRWFGPTARRDFVTSAQLTTTDLVDQLATRSYVLALPPEQRAAVLDVTRQRDGTGGSPRPRDHLAGVTARWVTVLAVPNRAFCLPARGSCAWVPQMKVTSSTRKPNLSWENRSAYSGAACI